MTRAGRVARAFTVLLWQVERITQSFTERLRFLSAERLRLTDELRRAHAASPRSPGKVAHAAADSEAMVASLHAEIGELKARLLRKDGGAPADGERGALQRRLLESESRYGTLAAQLSTCEDRLAEQRAQREWLELELSSVNERHEAELRRTASQVPPCLGTHRQYSIVHSQGTPAPLRACA